MYRILIDEKIIFSNELKKKRFFPRRNKNEWGVRGGEKNDASKFDGL